MWLLKTGLGLTLMMSLLTMTGCSSLPAKTSLASESPTKSSFSEVSPTRSMMPTERLIRVLDQAGCDFQTVAEAKNALRKNHASLVVVCK